MSKLHFANLSFDEKSSDTLCENENNLRFCLINIYFFFGDKESIDRGKLTGYKKCYGSVGKIHGKCVWIKSAGKLGGLKIRQTYEAHSLFTSPARNTCEQGCRYSTSHIERESRRFWLSSPARCTCWLLRPETV